MVGTAELIRVVAASLREFELGPYVLDPVMVATSGDLLIDNDLRSRNPQRADSPCRTRNSEHYRRSVSADGLTVKDEASVRNAAERLVSLGAKAALIKGGHSRGDDESVIVDVLYDGEFTFFTHPRLTTTSTHGTGCTLSAAITAQSPRESRSGNRFGLRSTMCMRRSPPRRHSGDGHGPLNHFAVGRSVTKARTSD